MEKLNEFVSLKYQRDEIPLQDNLGKQNFFEIVRFLYEPLRDTIKDFPRDSTESITETSIKNNKALENLNDKLLKILNDKNLLASYLMSPLSEITNPENNSEFKFVKVPNSKRVNDLLIHNTIPLFL